MHCYPSRRKLSGSLRGGIDRPPCAPAEPVRNSGIYEKKGTVGEKVRRKIIDARATAKSCNDCQGLELVREEFPNLFQKGEGIPDVELI